ncbi:MAG: hypothetical protein GW946_00625 [Candidatus Pacebacteria bacterium]|nr:hypothetical protein [Candidatus Paceibacterota bacterium]PIR60883.1 MAG: hypothetical protein COU67_00295 [Candidatus Pacebacteria bacterium CG10_big_fil_rev_8_21_14_0_10_44_54]
METNEVGVLGHRQYDRRELVEESVRRLEASVNSLQLTTDHSTQRKIVEGLTDFPETKRIYIAAAAAAQKLLSGGDIGQLLESIQQQVAERIGVILDKLNEIAGAASLGFFQELDGDEIWTTEQLLYEEEGLLNLLIAEFLEKNLVSSDGSAVSEQRNVASEYFEQPKQLQTLIESRLRSIRIAIDEKDISAAARILATIRDFQYDERVSVELRTTISSVAQEIDSKFQIESQLVGVVDLANWKKDDHPVFALDLEKVCVEVLSQVSGQSVGDLDSLINLTQKLVDARLLYSRYLEDLDYGFFSSVRNRLEAIDHLNEIYIKGKTGYLTAKSQLEAQILTILEASDEIISLRSEAAQAEAILSARVGVYDKQSIVEREKSLGSAIDTLLILVKQDSTTTSLLSAEIERAKSLFKDLRNKALENIENFEQFVSDISLRIAQIESEAPYLMTKEDNPLETFDSLYESIRQARDRSFDKNAINDLEQLVLKADYRKTKECANNTMTAYEGDDKGAVALVGNEVKDVIFGQRIFARVSRIVGAIHPDESAKFVADFEEFKTDLGLRMVVYLTEQSVNSRIMGWGSGDSVVPKDFPLALSDLFAIEGKQAEQFIRRSTSVVGKPAEVLYREEIETNPVLEKRKIVMADWETRNPKEVEVNVTAYGQVMRHLDAIYRGDHEDEFGLTGQSLNFNMDLIRRTVLILEQRRLDNKFEEDLVIAKSKGSPLPERTNQKYQSRINENHVKRAFLLHVLFLNQAWLAPSSSFVPDNIFYAFRWLDYLDKEILQGVHGYNTFITRVLFGALGAEKNYALDAPEQVVGKSGVVETFISNLVNPSEVRSKIEERFIEKGLYDRFWYLVELPLIDVKPDDQGKFTIFQPPLKYFMSRNGDGSFQRFAPEENGNLGKLVSFSDYVGEDGELYYELMPFSTLRPQQDDIRAYYNNAKNIHDFLAGILKAEEETFAVSGVPRSKLAGLKKKDKYAVTTLPEFGPEILAGFLNGDKVRDAVIHVIAFASAILQLRNGKEMNEVKRWIYGLQNTLFDEEQEAIVEALEAGFSQSSRVRAIVDGTIKQINFSNIFK